MPKLKYSVAIPVKDYADALSKVQKFVKRGFIDDVEWNKSPIVRATCTHVIVTVGNNLVDIHSHSGCDTKVILDRVRDVEKYYVKD